DAGARQAVDQRAFQLGRGGAAVIPDRDARAAGAAHHRREAAPDGGRVGGAERLADNATNVIFSEAGAVEAVGHAVSCCGIDAQSASAGKVHLAETRRASSTSRAALTRRVSSAEPPWSGWTAWSSRRCAAR